VTIVPDLIRNSLKETFTCKVLTLVVENLCGFVLVHAPHIASIVSFEVSSSAISITEASGDCYRSTPSLRLRLGVATEFSCLLSVAARIAHLAAVGGILVSLTRSNTF
jgi:hypothetical protein